jgi:hypothetical protein
MGSQTLLARVTASPTPLLVDVVKCAPTCSCACADQCAFSAADQSSCSSADRRADADSFRGFALAGLGIVTPAMPIRVSRRRKTADQNHHRKKKRYQTYAQNS